MHTYSSGPSRDLPAVQVLDINGNVKPQWAETVSFLGQKAATGFTALEEEILTGGASAMTRSGLLLGPSEALKVSTAFACRRVIAEDLASMRIDVVRRFYKNGRRITEVMPDHPLMELLNGMSGAPNDWMTIFELMEHWVGQATMYRGGYCWIVRDDKTSEVLELLPLLPGAVQVAQDQNWQPVYHVSGYGETFVAAPGDLLKLHGPMDDRALQGMPVSSVAREAIALASAIEGAAARFHQNDLRPSGALSLKGAKLTTEQLDKIKQQWKSQYGSGGEGGIALLQDDIEYKTFNATSADSQSLENRRYQVEEICRFFRVFPVAIGHQAGQGYGTVESFLEAHYTNTVRPWEIKVEQALNSQLLTPRERKNGILIRLLPSRRGTFSDRVNAYKGASSTFMTPNECREAEDLDPMDDVAMDKVQLPANNTGLNPSLTGKPGSDKPAIDKPGKPATDPAAKSAHDAYGHTLQGPESYGYPRDPYGFA
ncbi:MAG: phage portal protein [Hyphomicrobiaceae bacterium]